jgi:hypothetical protein
MSDTDLGSVEKWIFLDTNLNYPTRVVDVSYKYPTRVKHCDIPNHKDVRVSVWFIK